MAVTHDCKMIDNIVNYIIRRKEEVERIRQIQPTQQVEAASDIGKTNDTQN